MVGAIPPPRVMEIAADVLSALAAAHRAGLVHRDIKPDNIVLVETPHSPLRAKLVDFGVVKMGNAVALTQAGQVMGTPAYMAPEQWESRPVDARTDLYALGGCLYNALMGRTAVSSMTEAITAGFSQSRARAMPLERQAIAASLADVLARALSPNPADRYSTADEMANALRNAAHFLQTAVVNPSASPAAFLQTHLLSHGAVGASPPSPPLRPALAHAAQVSSRAACAGLFRAACAGSPCADSIFASANARSVAPVRISAPRSGTDLLREYADLARTLGAQFGPRGRDRRVDLLVPTARVSSVLTVCLGER